MNRRIRHRRLVASLICCVACGAAYGGSTTLPGVGSHLSVQLTSYKELRFQHLIRQQYDFSCGSAALATLLTHHYRRPVSEQDVFRAMFEHGDKAKIRREGFSMLDMKRYLEAVDFKAGGFRLTLDQLAKAGVPAIALTNINGYQHFVVVKGVRDDRILIGDPALGLKTVARSDFEAGWNGIFFLIRSHAAVGREGFDRDSDWSVLAQAPVGSQRGADLASFTLQLTRPGLK